MQEPTPPKNKSKFVANITKNFENQAQSQAQAQTEATMSPRSKNRSPNPVHRNPSENENSSSDSVTSQPRVLSAHQIHSGSGAPTTPRRELKSDSRNAESKETTTQDTTPTKLPTQPDAPEVNFELNVLENEKRILQRSRSKSETNLKEGLARTALKTPEKEELPASPRKKTDRERKGSSRERKSKLKQLNKTPHPSPVKSDTPPTIHPRTETIMVKGETALIIGETASTLEIPDNYIRIEYNELKKFIRTEAAFNKKFGHDEVIQIDNKEFAAVRNKVAFELYTTEETYVKSLQLCTMLYLEPITQWITASSAARLQGVVVMKMIQFYKNILQLHSLFLFNLRTRFKSWSEHQKIGDLTITITPCLRMYKLYGEDYENMLKLLDNFKRNSSTYRSIIKEGDNHPLNKLALESMLILPIQRIPRYVLLIQELTKRTENDHPDFVPLTKSLTALKKTSEDLNTAILQGEKRLKCIEISKLIKWEDLVVPHRFYINELVLEVNNGKKQEQQRLIIFNDLLLFLSDTPEPVKLDTISIDSHLVLKDESETSLILQSNSSGILKSKSTTTLIFPSEEKKTEFFSILSKEMKTQEQANQSRTRKM